MKRFRTILILILISAAVISCNREKNLKCTDANTVKVPPHAMDYFYFKVGTWWVYECEQTGERDSLWVSQSNTSPKNPYIAKSDCKCGKGLCFQEAFVHIQNYKTQNLGGTLIYYSMLRIALQTLDPKTQYGIIELKESYGLKSGLPGYRMFYKENTYANPTGNGGVVKELDSMIVNGNTYKNVMEYAYKQAAYPDWYLTAWYGKNVHLIRYIKDDKSIWNLVKYNIVK